jgi:C4-type Zn-finger protein
MSDGEREDPTVGRNVVGRERLRRGHVECPLCERQLAAVADHLVAFGRVETLTSETADAVACPVCGGVSFVVEE